MKSKDFLRKKHKFRPLLHEVLWTVRRYWWVSVFGMLVFLGSTYLCMQLEGNDTDTFALVMRDFEILPRIAGVLYGIFAAFCMFRFLWSRRESVMTLSVGTVRRKQFLLRYLFGFLSVILAVVVPLVFTYHTEMSTLGEDYWGLCSHYTFVFTMSLMTLTLLSYTVGVLVAVLCGHFVPAVLTVSGVLAAPYAVLWSVQKLVDYYLFGTPIGDKLLANHLNAGLFTMMEDAMRWRPYAKYIVNGSGTGWDGDLALSVKAEVVLPGVRIVLLFVLMLGLALLACWAYCRRPAENAGKATVHPALAHAVALTMGFFAAVLMLNVEGPIVAVTALLLIVLVLAAFLIRMALTRSFKETLRQYFIPCGTAGLCLAVIICLGTGWFGYSDFVPDVRDVKSVTVSCDQDVQFIRQLMHYKGGSVSSFSMATPTTSSLDAAYWAQNGDMKLSMLYAYGADALDDRLPTMTEAEDIEVAMAIHNAILADGQQTYTGVPHEEYGKSVIPASYRITYRLQNGKTVERYYKYLTINTLEKTFEAHDTTAYRSEVGGAYSKEAFERAVKIQLGDPLFGDFQVIDFTPEERDLLAAALGKDMANMTVSDTYFGTDENQHDNVIGIIRAQNVSGYRTTETHPSDAFYVTFYITALHKNTLAFLEERGLTDCFADGYTVTDVRTQRYEPRFVTREGQRNIQTNQIFYSCDNIIQVAIDPNFDSKDQREQLEHNTAPVPEDEWDSYIQNSRAVALLTRPGTMVQIILTNTDGEQKLVTRYLYDEDAR